MKSSEEDCNARRYRKNDRVIICDVDQTDRIRGLENGMIGVVVEPERREKKTIIRCPFVKFENGETVWMAMHQLAPVPEAEAVEKPRRLKLDRQYSGEFS